MAHIRLHRMHVCNDAMQKSARIHFFVRFESNTLD